MIPGDAFYKDLFRTDETGMQKVIAEAQSCGASYADLFFEKKQVRCLILQDGQVSVSSLFEDFGVGIRALDGERTGYAYCDGTSLPSMIRCAKAAASISSHCGTPVNHSYGPGLQVCPDKGNNFYPVTRDWDEVSVQEEKSFLEKIDRILRDADSRVISVQAVVRSSKAHVMMYNSFSQLCCDTRPLGSISATIAFAAGKTTQTLSCSKSFRKGGEMLSDSLIREIKEKLIGQIDKTLQAVQPKGGKMPVVMGAGASGILLHEAIGHSFEADFNRKGQSIFCDRMGKRICAKGINVVDDGTLMWNRGSCNYDDEGIPGQKTYMVRDGVLESFLHDRISAAHYGVSPTGNGRREDFHYAPIPRMRLTYMEPGDCDPESIVSSVKKGIYVDEFTGGQVKIGEGDFTFYVKGGYLIENGKLTTPVKDINIIGNGPDALAAISTVGNDLVIDNSMWICGKEQNVPVGCGMPTVLVDELTIGGAG